jgi:hypothetical protein
MNGHLLKRRGLWKNDNLIDDKEVRYSQVIICQYFPDGVASRHSRSKVTIFLLTFASFWFCIDWDTPVLRCRYFWITLYKYCLYCLYFVNILGGDRVDIWVCLQLCYDYNYYRWPGKSHCCVWNCFRQEWYVYNICMFMILPSLCSDLITANLLCK